MVKKLQFLIGDRFDFFPYDQKDLDGLLFIQGCERSCALESLNPGKIPSFSITKETEWGKAIDWLENLNKKKGD